LCYKVSERFRNSRSLLRRIMIGEKLGKYTILEVVGSGSMGTVYKAEDPEGRLVALKLVRSQVLYNQAKRERFLQCALIASEIRHEGICPVLEIGDDNDDLFVIYPFVQGKTLEQYMERKSLPWSRALDIALDAGSVLQAIHEAGAAHRGFKPANIWILGDRDHRVLLSDCCLARFTEIAKHGLAHSAARSEDFADTLIPLSALAYMSPEQVRGQPVDYRTDIFSFGVVLYEMLGGRHPFEARNSLSRISAILEADPPALGMRQPLPVPQVEQLIGRALAKRPDQRYPSMKELLCDMQSLRIHAAPEAARSLPRPGIRRWLASVFCRRSL